MRIESISPFCPRTTPVRRALAVAIASASASAVALCGCGSDVADPPDYGVYLVFLTLADVQGEVRLPTAECAAQPIRASWLRPFVVGPDLSPDFMDRGAPPFCMAFRWDADGAPNLNAADAGTISIQGHSLPMSVPFSFDPSAAPQQPTSIPSEIDCTRVDNPINGLMSYACNSDPMRMILGDLIADDTAVAISASGGAHIGGFTASNLRAPPTVEPSNGFDLGHIDIDAPLIASWAPTDANTVLIELFAQTVDPMGRPNAFGQVLCMSPSSTGSKAIPSRALEVLPRAEGTNVLFVQTTVVGTNLSTSDEGWGHFMVGAGRGKTGLSCVRPDGTACCGQ